MPRKKPRRTDAKKAKKIGKYGESVISTFKGAVSALKYRYKPDFPDMVAFMHFNAFGKNCIFQRIQSFPLHSITYTNDSHSIMFNAKWISDGGLKYVLSKKYFELDLKESGQKVEWKDVDSFGLTSRDGERVLRGKRWLDVEDADRIDSDIDIRIDDVKAINMYDWGFEILGEVISLLVVSRYVEVPSFGRDISVNVSNLSFDFGKLIDDDNIIVRWSQPGYEPIKEKVSDFDKVLFGGEVEEKTENEVKKIGQRCMKNIILDDEVQQ
jgi:hypothetical protein